MLMCNISLVPVKKLVRKLNRLSSETTGLVDMSGETMSDLNIKILLGNDFQRLPPCGVHSTSIAGTRRIFHWLPIEPEHTDGRRMTRQIYRWPRADVRVFKGETGIERPQRLRVGVTLRYRYLPGGLFAVV